MTVSSRRVSFTIATMALILTTFAVHPALAKGKTATVKPPVQSSVAIKTLGPK